MSDVSCGFPRLRSVESLASLRLTRKKGRLSTWRLSSTDINDISIRSRHNLQIYWRLLQTFNQLAIFFFTRHRSAPLRNLTGAQDENKLASPRPALPQRLSELRTDIELPAETEVAWTSSSSGGIPPTKRGKPDR